MLRKKHNDLRKFADTFGIEWREEARRNDARRAEALKQLNAQIERRLAEALAKEKRTGAGNPWGTGVISPTVSEGPR